MELPVNQRTQDIIQVLQYVLPRTGVNIPTINSTSIIPIEIIDAMMSPENIEGYFKKAFTHESFNFEKSYDAMEFNGDLLCNLFANRKIKRTNPNLDAEESTNILNYYKSNEIFAEALTTAIPDVERVILTRNDVKKTEKMFADVFEALIEAVFQTANSVMPGIGYSCAENVFILLTNSIKIEHKHIRKPSKQLALELLPKGTTEEAYETAEGTFYVGITINENGLETIASFDIDQVVQTEFYSVLGSKKAASNEAYTLLIEYLERLDITSDSSAARKINKFIVDSGYGTQIMDKMANMHETIKFVKEDISEDVTLWKLIAKNLDTDERSFIASTASKKGSAGFQNAKTKLILKYITSDPRDTITRNRK